MQDYREFIDEVLVDEETIEKRVKELGDQISRDYAGEDLLVVCLLRGGLTFTADLTRHITITHELDCMSLSSYGTGHYASSGNVRVNLDLITNIEKRHVLLVEDIVDSGRTLAHVLTMLKTREPVDVKVCVLLDKKCGAKCRLMSIMLVLMCPISMFLDMALILMNTSGICHLLPAPILKSISNRPFHKYRGASICLCRALGCTGARKNSCTGRNARAGIHVCAAFA